MRRCQTFHPPSTFSGVVSAAGSSTNKQAWAAPPFPKPLLSPRRSNLPAGSSSDQTLSQFQLARGMERVVTKTGLVVIGCAAARRRGWKSECVVCGPFVLQPAPQPTKASPVGRRLAAENGLALETRRECIIHQYLPYTPVAPLLIVPRAVIFTPLIRTPSSRPFPASSFESAFFFSF